ncbi:hypothetical protein ISCGN_029916 [Ixodes scapularis]
MPKEDNGSASFPFPSAPPLPSALESPITSLPPADHQEFSHPGPSASASSLLVTEISSEDDLTAIERKISMMERKAPTECFEPYDPEKQLGLTKSEELNSYHLLGISCIAALSVQKTGKAKDGELLDVCIMYDGTWHKRGHMSRFSFEVMIELESGLVLDFSVHTNYCQLCTQGPKPGTEGYTEWMEDHRPNCQKNFNGSAEVAHEMRCLRRWLKELEARLPNQMAVSSSWTVPEIQERLQAQQPVCVRRSPKLQQLLRASKLRTRTPPAICRRLQKVFPSQFPQPVLLWRHPGGRCKLCVHTNYCQLWTQGPKPGTEGYTEWMEDHRPNCQKNFSGSAGAMEVEAATVIFGCSVKKYDMQYTTMLCHGNSKAFSMVAGLEFYNKEVKKEDCVKHVAKRRCAGLEALRKAKKGLEVAHEMRCLRRWLKELEARLPNQMAVSSSWSVPEIQDRLQAQQLVRQELRQRETSLQLFAEEAQGLGALHPSMKEEVGRRVNLLSNKWDAVERAVDPDKDARAAPTQAFQEVAHEMRCLRRWLKELEARLPNQMAVSSSWSVPEIQDRLQAQQESRRCTRPAVRTSAFERAARFERAAPLFADFSHVRSRINMPCRKDGATGMNTQLWLQGAAILLAGVRLDAS